MGNRLKTIARQAYTKLRGGTASQQPLRLRFFPPAGAVAALALERQGRIDDALEAWRAVSNFKVAQGQILRLMISRARHAAQQGNWAAAAAAYEVILPLAKNDSRVIRGLESAALHAARLAQGEGRWLDACKMWLLFSRAGSQTDKCRRNLTLCARLAGESADSASKVKEALEAWECVRQVDPASRDVRRGLVWCHMTLAREAERRGDADVAETHWTSVIALSPDDLRAREALRRLDRAPRPIQQRV